MLISFPVEMRNELDPSFHELIVHAESPVSTYICYRDIV